MIRDTIEPGIKTILAIGLAAAGLNAKDGKDVQAQIQADLAGKGNRPQIGQHLPQSVLLEMGIGDPAKSIDPLPVINNETETSNLREFGELKEALTFLEGQEGAKWIPGRASVESEFFPWRNSEAWENFGNLTTWGYESHSVYLVPNQDNTEYAVMGVEHINGDTIIDYIDSEGKPVATRIKGNIDLRTLLGEDYSTLSVNHPQVWDDFDHSNADCTPSMRTPVPGVVDGFSCSTDRTRRHYFQGSGKQP